MIDGNSRELLLVISLAFTVHSAVCCGSDHDSKGAAVTVDTIVDYSATLNEFKERKRLQLRVPEI